jgi:glyoxylase-like metal-dependent hydrolase (beta-lactamase superfamily II)
MLFRQFFDSASSTYTYLIASSRGREAVIIDPVKEQVAQYLTAIEQLGLRLVKAIDTHTHADHITGLGDLRERTGCLSIMGEYTRADCVSCRVTDGEILDTDGIRLQALYTPGHTSESFSFVLAPDAPVAVFSGDVLMIRGTGRTDFQNGDPGKSWDSITRTLFALPDDTTLYPAHDYKGWMSSSIGEERRFNPRLAGKTREQYIEIMNSLDLPDPKMMDVAIPANLACGLDAG